MSILSIAVFVVIVILTTSNAEVQKQGYPTPSVQNFKEFVANMVKEQSSKIQTLLKKIQTNAQSVLKRIENIKQDSRAFKKKSDIIIKDGHQIESPLMKRGNEIIDSTNVESRSFNNHYATTSYGASGNANYGTATYHHHSIGFDPINIVVSMSLLSFLLQALQGLLTRARLPTPVVEARNLESIQALTKNIEENLGIKSKDKYYLKKKHFKRYFRR